MNSVLETQRERDEITLTFHKESWGDSALEEKNMFNLIYLIQFDCGN